MKRIIYGSLSVLTALGTAFVAARAEMFNTQNATPEVSENVVQLDGHLSGNGADAIATAASKSGASPGPGTLDIAGLMAGEKGLPTSGSSADGAVPSGLSSAGKVSASVRGRASSNGLVADTGMSPTDVNRLLATRVGRPQPNAQAIAAQPSVTQPTTIQSVPAQTQTAVSGPTLQSFPTGPARTTTRIVQVPADAPTGSAEAVPSASPEAELEAAGSAEIEITETPVEPSAAPGDLSMPVSPAAPGSVPLPAPGVGIDQVPEGEPIEAPLEEDSFESAPLEEGSLEEGALEAEPSEDDFGEEALEDETIEDEAIEDEAIEGVEGEVEMPLPEAGNSPESDDSFDTPVPAAPSAPSAPMEPDSQITPGAPIVPSAPVTPSTPNDVTPNNVPGTVPGTSPAMPLPSSPAVPEAPLPVTPLPEAPIEGSPALPEEGGFPESGAVGSPSDRLVGEGFSPFQLSYLAIGGGLKEVGIPGGNLLLDAYEAGDISAEDIFEAGAVTKRLGTAASDPDDYVKSIDQFLKLLSRDGLSS